MDKKNIVITSIFEPTKELKEFIKLGFNVIYVSDKKSPNINEKEGLCVVSVSYQKSIFKDFNKILPFNHYSRKNLGYLYAMKDSEYILETDDDNFPYKIFPIIIKDNKKLIHLSSDSGFINIYKYFSAKKNIWQRGFPLERIKNTDKILKKSKYGSYPIQQSLINGDTDVDAIYRLTDGEKIDFADKNSVAVDKGIFSPINSQNTLFLKKAYALMYLPISVSSRVTDIYRGYIAQRIIWEDGSVVVFNKPTVFQKRNYHNLYNDFIEEIPLYKFVNILAQELLNMSLSSDYLQSLRLVYERLVRRGLFDRKELHGVYQWVREIEKL